MFKMHHLERNLERKRKMLLPIMMKFIEEERTVVATRKLTLSKALNEKDNQVLEVFLELSHTKKKVKQLTIGFAYLSKVLSYGRT